MKTMKNKYTVLFLSAALALGSCAKQLEIDPRQSIDAETALTSKEAIDASITAIYGRMKSARWYGRDMITHPDALADNGYATGSSNRLVAESNNVFNNTFTTTIWTSGYAGINQLNLTLKAIAGGIPNATAADVARWEGNLYFLRGMFYFDMMRVYAYIPGAVVASQDRGGVPLVLEGIEDAGTALAFKPSRAPINDVYTQIVKDFEAAESRLAASTSASASGSAVATKTAAQAMLARVNLYRKDFTNAKKWADLVIAARPITALASYVSGWRAEIHPETIFHIRFATNAENIGVNESLQTSFTTIVTLPGLTSATGGFGDLVPTLDLLNVLGITLKGGNTNNNFLGPRSIDSLRSTDIRNRLYEPGTAGRTKGWIECTKFLGKNGFINLDNVPVIRASEMYLIRAEAAAVTGSPVFNEANAIADLKALKAQRYEGYAGSAMETADNALTGAALQAEILLQNRLEFAFEGHRFFDLKRLGLPIVKGAPNPNAPVSPTDARILAPILQADVDGNPNLKQNFGY
ncbi:MAG TPA: RagB/SusD family nutrient uptake outer membrane protein [Phnomibacter sp.]|nr:RagB/SusD family nutrient uptake outer membrane protein [Phnomibacter sp.]